MAKRHVSPPFSSFAHLKPRRGCQASGPRVRGCERVYRRCRQFWSNICPRKNKSPLSLTTGRASLVSNRALLNRRRITDPRVARPFRLLLPFALARPLQSSYPARPIFFLLFTTAAERDAVGILSSRLPGVFIENFIVLFTAVIFTTVVIPSFPSRSTVSRGQARLKSRVPTKNAGRDCLVREHESRHAETLRTYLASCATGSFFR